MMQTGRDIMDDQQAKQPVPRKPYSRPQLKVYGDIRQLTQNASRNQVRDGGSNSQRT
ncbi:MAG: hypothetical protein QOH21_3430 [Acidobacteriota bacterium]|jgi:hypothetical protein|nr:hypothetical protein [Acidobacteriota bacterium]